MNEGHAYAKCNYHNHAAGNSGIVTGGDGPQVLGSGKSVQFAVAVGAGGCGRWQGC